MALTRVRKRGIRADAVNEHVSFTNIVDAGSEGTKVASGTTAQRGSTTGQWRYNATTGYFEGRNENGTFSTLVPDPTISSVDDTDVDSAGGGNQTFVVTGTNFQNVGTISFIGNDSSTFNATSTTFNSSTQVTAVVAKSSFVNAKEPYDIKYTGGDGKAFTLENQINVDNAPNWSTSAGSLGSIAESIAMTNITLSATDPEGDSVTYAETTSNLSGIGLALSSAGVLSGTPNAVGGNTTTSFTVRATAGSKTADRNFTITVNNITTNALLWDATNLTGNNTYNFPNANGLGLTGQDGGTLSPSTAISFSNVRGSAGTMGHGYLLTDKQDSWGHYTHNDGRDSTIGDTFWSTTLESGHSQSKYSSWWGGHHGGGHNNYDVWFAMDYGDNPSFKITRLTGYSEWRTGTANMYFYGTNDISNLNGNTGNSDAGQMTTTGLTNLVSALAIQSTSWDTSTFTNNTFYRYYVLRVMVVSTSSYDWGLQRIKYYGDYY
tara:strand:+ start:1003 stop:2475 length:1473 start_codon:yes stop_codon:yes gene_type:complete